MVGKVTLLFCITMSIILQLCFNHSPAMASRDGWHFGVNPNNKEPPSRPSGKSPPPKAVQKQSMADEQMSVSISQNGPSHISDKDMFSTPQRTILPKVLVTPSGPGHKGNNAPPPRPSYFGFS